LDEVYKGAVIFLEAAIMEPATQVAGAQVIFDMDGLSLQQTWQFSPPFAKRIVDWLQVRIVFIVIIKIDDDRALEMTDQNIGSANKSRLLYTQLLNWKNKRKMQTQKL
jgi:hypothetical protein